MSKFEIQAKIFGKTCKVNEVLSSYTTLRIGGQATFFVEPSTENELISLVKLANKNKIPYFLIAGGSNLLISDEGFKGLVIHPSFSVFKVEDDKVWVAAPTSLSTFIDFLIEKGYAGMEKMIGIPGSVGGAIYGNAGAYGQTISDFLTQVKVFDGKNIRWVKKDGCGFTYRESIFKENKWIILKAEFIFKHEAIDILKTTSVGILKMRYEKFPPGLLCPGSFFKNVEVEKLSEQQLRRIPSEKIVYGKIPAGYLLEAVGAKGARLEDIKITDYHANLFINLGKGKAFDFFNLARKFQDKVKKKFGIRIEPEVQLVGFNTKL